MFYRAMEVKSMDPTIRYNLDTHQLVVFSNFVTYIRIKPIVIFLKRAIKIAIVHFFVLIEKR